jgi:hypothetical protein
MMDEINNNLDVGALHPQLYSNLLASLIARFTQHSSFVDKLFLFFRMSMKVAHMLFLCCSRPYVVLEKGEKEKLD